MTSPAMGLGPRIKEQWGLLPGQTTLQLYKEIQALEEKDRLDLCRMFSEQGLPTVSTVLDPR